MMLWIVLTFMISLGVAGLTFAMARSRGSGRPRTTTTSILAAQLADADSQMTTGDLSPGDAATLKAEIRRRILVEAREPQPIERPFPARALPFLAVGIAGFIALGATGLYALLGRPDLAAGAPAQPIQEDASSPHPGADVPAMIAQLEARMRQSPNDPEGWRLLGWSYLVTGRAADAAAAYARAVALAPHNADYHSSEGEALVRAAGGQVTASALDSFRAALKDDPADPRTKYYLALYKDQSGDHSGAMTDWIALIRSAPPDAPWLPDVRQFVEKVARDHGLDIAARLPPEPLPGDSRNRPTAAQVEAANQMPAADRNAMIQAMVERLAGALKSNPKNVEGWERLMRARMVLGEAAEAAAAYRDASAAFADAPDVRTRLRNSARALGVPGV